MEEAVTDSIVRSTQAQVGDVPALRNREMNWEAAGFPQNINEAYMPVTEGINEKPEGAETDRAADIVDIKTQAPVADQHSPSQI